MYPISEIFYDITDINYMVNIHVDSCWFASLS